MRVPARAVRMVVVAVAILVAVAMRMIVIVAMRVAVVVAVVRVAVVGVRERHAGIFTCTPKRTLSAPAPWLT